MSAGVWVFLTILPTLILNSKREDRPITTQDYVGWSMWVTGFLLETIADSQKSSFRANPENQVGITESINCIRFELFMTNYVCDPALFRLVLLKQPYDKDWFAREILVLMWLSQNLSKILHANKSWFIVY